MYTGATPVFPFTSVPAAPLTPSLPSALAQRSPSPLVPRSDSDRWPPLRAARAFDLACRPGCRTGNSGKPKAENAAPGVRRAPDAVRRAAALGIARIAGAPEHPERGLLRIVQVGAPLPHVAVHVVQPQLVRWIRTDPRCKSQVLPLRRLAGRPVAVEVRLLGGQVVGRLVQVEVIRTFF